MFSDRFKKYALTSTLVLIFFSLLPTGETITYAQFKDVKGNPYAESIEYLESKDVIQGYDQGKTFRPEDPVTLAAFLKMMLANYGFDAQNARTSRIRAPFKDVPQKSWFGPYIQRAWEMGILEDKKNLEPGKALSRVEATQLALEFLNIKTPLAVESETWAFAYKDVHSESWFAPTVLYGESYGLLEGIHSENTKTWGPHKKLTRGEAAQMIYNMDMHLYGENALETLRSALLDAKGNLTIPHFDIFLDVWNRVNNEYYKADEISQEKLIYSALKGLIEGLDDPYSLFFDPPEAEDFSDYIEGEYGGVGVYLTQTDDGWRVDGFVIDSPAEKAGLQYNDFIIAVDGVEVIGKTNREVINLIRGEAETEVKLTIVREGLLSPFEVSITRELIDIGFIAGKMIDEALYVDINTFNAEGASEFETTIQALIEENPDFNGFIFDLRNNPGGYLSTVSEMLEHFIPAGTPLLYYKLGTQLIEVGSNGSGEWGNHPIVILINEGSASASEIMALDLKENNEVVLVGQTTYGKGTIQSASTYSDGSRLNLTIAEWLSSKQASIHQVGITPDHEVERTTENLQNQEDPQLDKALQILESL